MLEAQIGSSVANIAALFFHFLVTLKQLCYGGGRELFWAFFAKKFERDQPANQSFPVKMFRAQSIYPHTPQVTPPVTYAVKSALYFGAAQKFKDALFRASL
jgi:hypothetical protein